MPPSDRSAHVLATLGLVLAVCIVYAPIRHAGFIHIDDPLYILENPHVRDGFTVAGIRHVLVEQRGALWMPLAFLSHMLDVELFGLSPVGPHVVNVLVHAINTALVFGLFVRTTHAFWPSLITAAVFGLHPLRIESVAWIAERKDVLSVLFGLLTLHAWVGWVQRPSRTRYAFAMASFACALLAKPMLVTLPLLLLCFDVWPLGRTGAPHDRPSATGWSLVREKVPLFLLAGTVVLTTFVAARSAGGFVTEYPPSARLANALVSWCWYVAKTVWPSGLSVVYPFRLWEPWLVVAGTIGIVGTIGLAAATWRRAPWIAVGIVWFAIAIAPVVGIVQVGVQGMADRFTYLPSIGLLAAIVWTLAAVGTTRTTRVALGSAAMVVVLALSVASYRQVGRWRDSVTLFEHSIAVTRDNWYLEGVLGDVLINQERPADALAHFAAALRIRPQTGGAAFGMGLALDKLGRREEAAGHYHTALLLDPTSARTHNNLGAYLAGTGDLMGGLYHFVQAVRLNPEAPDLVANLSRALEQAGVTDVEHYVRGVARWGSVIAADRRGPGGATYGRTLERELRATKPEIARTCLGAASQGRVPTGLFLEVDGEGTVKTVTAIPATDGGRCLSEELRTARLPAPPFAPFHVAVSFPIEG